MEDSQNIYVVVWFDEIGDPVVTVKKDPDFAWIRGTRTSALFRDKF